MQNKVMQLRKGRNGRLRPGHPWIYKAQVLKAKFPIMPGSMISVIDSNDKFIGNGYYNPRSEIAIRLFSFKDEDIDAAFFNKKIKIAAEKRKGLLAKTNAFRAVFSEADSLPGLIVDIYADTAVFQALTLGMDKLKTLAVKGIEEVLKPKYIYEKSTSPFRKLEGLRDDQRWWGESGKTMVEISEGRARFLVDIENGHKTGFYLDQRRSRMGLEGFVNDKKTLDLFCYTGAFSISAALFGASSVRGVDIKEEWLGLARKNAELNVVSGKVEFIKKDSFSAMEEICASGEKFDVIIVDPPSFLKTKDTIASASKGYKELNLSAMKALNEGGILATFSCSHNMPNQVFSKILKDAASAAGKKITILKRCHQAEDHPIIKSIPETEYLKGYFLKIDNN